MLNAFVLELITTTTITLAELDQYSQLISWPSCRKKLKQRFFAESIVTNPKNSHIKCFATECLQAIQVLLGFIRHYMDRSGTLPQHVACFRLLGRIMDIHTSSDPLSRLDDFRRLLDAHHNAFLAAYGDDMIKVKAHLSYHIADRLEEHGKLYNCFSPERKHRLAKTISRHFVGPNSESYVLKRSLVELFAAISEMPLRKCFMESPQSASALQNMVPLAPNMGGIHASRHCHTHVGKLYTADVVRLSHHGGTWVLGATLFFAGGYDTSLTYHLWICVEIYTQSTDEWRLSGVRQFFDVNAIVDNLPFAKVPHGIMPLLPSM